MIQEEDFMIGDWVQSKTDKLIFQIKTHWDIYNAKDFEPVPITSKMLINNRFIKRNNPGYPGHYDYELPTKHMVFKLFAFNNSNFSFNINQTAMEIKYVHELQHALKLCKIDKEIKL